MSSGLEEHAPASEPLFRASKRRKIIRKRRDDEEGEDGHMAPRSPPGDAPINTLEAVASEEPSNPVEAEDSASSNRLIRQRRPAGSKRGGIAFTSSVAHKRSEHDSPVDTETNDQQALVPAAQNIEQISSRFTVPEGNTRRVDNKYMNKYIDSRLASKFPDNAASAQSPAATPLDSELATPEPGSSPSQSNTDATTQENVRATAPTIVQGAQQPQQPKTRPPRLGRDGKPLRPRKDRNRRTSSDIARENLVMQVLSESRLGLYEQPVDGPFAGASSSANPTPNPNAGQDEEADERMEREFRRNFVAAQRERASRRPAPAPPGAKGDPPRGPKLGGSRSQRAAMHRSLEEKAAQGIKPGKK